MSYGCQAGSGTTFTAYQTTEASTNSSTATTAAATSVSSTSSATSSTAADTSSTTTPSAASVTPVRAGLSNGAEIGIGVGVGVGVGGALVAIALWFALRRRKSNANNHHADAPLGDQPDQPTEQDRFIHEMDETHGIYEVPSPQPKGYKDMYEEPPVELPTSTGVHELGTEGPRQL